MNRIEWDPLDTTLLTVLDGQLRVHSGDDIVEPFDPIDRVSEQRFQVCDARWLADGPIMVLDESGTLRWYQNRIVLDEKSHRWSVQDACIAAGGTRIVAIHHPQQYSRVIVVEDLAKSSFEPRLDGVSFGRGTPAPTMALSGDGTRLALAYETEQPGRGFAIWNLDNQTLVDRSWQEQPIDRMARARLAFDHAGKRLAMAVPEDGVPAMGVMRISEGDAHPRTRLGGATAVALEYRGNLVAYAHRTPPPGARGRLQFDYLATPARGPEIVEVLDTQTLECDLPDVVALAFSRDRRRLACLSSTGQVEVVPVP